mgnify:CR=1 FL=1
MASEAMQDVVATVGLDAALTLAVRRQGRTLHVPEAVERAEWLCCVLGDEAVERLVAEMGGMDIELPALGWLERERRNELVARLAAHDVRPHDIAEAAGLGPRQLRRVLDDEAGVIAAYRRLL